MSKHPFSKPHGPETDSGPVDSNSDLTANPATYSPTQTGNPGGSGRLAGCHSASRPEGRLPEWRAGEQPESRGPRSRRPARSGLVINRISAQKSRREITLEVGQRDIRIRRSLRLTAFPGTAETRTGGGARSEVVAFSKASRRRLLFTARNFPGLKIMLTLTYPADFPMDGRLVKNHWRRFRQWMARNGATAGLWVLEFQKRGAPHFHVFIREPLDRTLVSKAWYRIVGSDDRKHLSAGTRIEEFRHPPALGSYVMKYAAKFEQKQVPDGFESVGRFWGTWGNPNISEIVRLPQSLGKHFVRTIRKAHIKARRDWTSHKHFRDNGRSGFIAWETSPMVRRLVNEFLETGVMFPS